MGEEVQSYVPRSEMRIIGVCGGLCNHVIGKVGFEDGLKRGKQSEAKSSLQRVCNVPEIIDTVNSIGGLDQVPLWADRIPNSKSAQSVQ